MSTAYALAHASLERLRSPSRRDLRLLRLHDEGAFLRSAYWSAAWALCLGCRSSGATTDRDPNREAAAVHAGDVTPDAAVHGSDVTPDAAIRGGDVTSDGAIDAEADAEPPVDFEDEFDYGSADEEAGTPDADPKAVAALKAGKTTYSSYMNPRFGFAVDVPSEFDAMPPPVNGDGLQFRLGKLAVMTASGGYWDEPRYDICPNSIHVTARRSTAKSCFATGKANGYIFWERTEVRHGVAYDVRLQYVESLKAAMDPVVKHVNESWIIGRPAEP
jgi:hypothetical protein